MKKFVVLLIKVGFLISFFYAAGEYAVRGLNRVQEARYESSNSAKNVLEQKHVSRECNNTVELAGNLINKIPVKNAVRKDSLCEITLASGVSFGYPANWQSTFLKTYWNELSFFYPDYTPEDPQLVVVEVGVIRKGNLRSMLLEYFESLEQGNDSEDSMGATVTPLVFKDQVGSVTDETFGTKKVLHVNTKSGGLPVALEDTQFFVFDVEGASSFWVMRVNGEFLKENREQVESLIYSFSSI